MKTFIKNICFSLLVVIMYSCIEELDMKTYPHDDKIVINSLFSPDSNFYVLISKSTAISSAYNTETIFYNDTIFIDSVNWYESVKIDNPVVELWKNNVFIENLTSIGNGIYRSFNEPRQVGVKYELRINAEGFESVKANDIIPEKVEIEDIEYQKVGNIFNDSVFYTKVDVQFTDPANKANYYEIRCIRTYYSMDYGGGCTSGGALYCIDPVIPEIYNSESFEMSYVFTDELINGKTYNLSVYLPDFLHFCDICSEFYFIIELRSISYKYFQYQIQLYKYFSLNSTSFLQQIYSVGEPVIMYTNVENGYGVFVGYSADTVTVTQATGK